MSEMIQRAPMNVPFVIPVYGKKEAHQKERDAHGAAKRNNCKVTTSIMRAVDVSDYDYSMTLLRVTVVQRWVVSDFVDSNTSGVPIAAALAAKEGE